MDQKNKDKEQQWFTRAEAILQAAYNLDNQLQATLTEEQVFSDAKEVGAKRLHMVYYDGCYYKMEGIKSHMSEYPNGIFVRLIKWIRDSRTREGDYLKETLNRMYGIRD